MIHMENNKKIINKLTSIVWPISLIGLPTLLLVILFTLLFVGDFNSNKLIFIIVTSSYFITCILAGLNCLFVFYTIARFRNCMPAHKIFFHVICGLMANVMWAYVVANMWSRNNIEIYSFKNKEVFSFSSFTLYASFIFSVLLSGFMIFSKVPY